MAQPSAYRQIRDAANAAFFAARAAHYAAIDECAQNYSADRWEQIGRTETSYRAARDAMDRANSDLLRAELVNVSYPAESEETAAGIAAWKRGVSYAACPHPHGIKRMQWQDGWLHMDHGYAVDEDKPKASTT